MRDLLLVAFLLIAIYYSFKRPYVGAAAWIWIALMAPAEWAFGFSQSFRLNLTIVIVSLLAWIINKNKYKYSFSGMQFLVLLFCFWMLISTIFNLRINSELAWDKFIEFAKVIALFLFIIMTIRTKKEVDTLIWSIVLAISAYAAMEGVKFILSGGGHRIVGRSGILADRNDLAVAINMCLPLVLYLLGTTKNKNLRLGLILIAVLNVVAVMGTYSRGGFIGLSILAIAIWIKSERKVLFLMLALISLPVLYANAPAEWKERQSTIETAATEDGSFIGRIWAWKIATLIALDNPVTGGGFKATTDSLLWRTYAPITPDFGPVYTPPIPDHVRPKAAHNIYFQVLASSGFVGLIIFLFILAGTYLQSLHCSNAKIRELTWVSELSRAISLAIIGYGITGLNVSLAYFELLYALIAIQIILKSRITSFGKNNVEFKNS
ncbi:putative O-glycosylation ligase, exosortase A system-associated [Thalassotalea euphylliae]|uniref:Putative O-glycosylation ligase, exosortase A system-associated n=1 Tax=Thalassotalea euphylliae TaxID=1655234 RepID=A0A3E0U2I5_9GAMM|nr:putative O-glycosylation ligase, exosortase A system-associated [Thalassotalea euphylliae]REL31138.1 putative O-glycosylation ligase, exosortase A system-associated [Thalassotalea euphylliae]